MIHEAAIFNFNVPGQVAIAHALTESEEEYEGKPSWFDYQRDMFAESRDIIIEGIKASSLPLIPCKSEGSFVITVDISQCKDLVPERFYLPDYEKDSETTVLQKLFPEGRALFDHAFC